MVTYRPGRGAASQDGSVEYSSLSGFDASVFIRMRQRRSEALLICPRGVSTDALFFCLQPVKLCPQF